MDILDDPRAMALQDPQGMLEAIYGLPQQCRQAWQEAQTWDLPPWGPIDKIVVLGMGGSAIAADYVATLPLHGPLLTVRGYEMPTWLDHTTLVVASSYSGQTEETLSAFRQALLAPVAKAVITTDGQLLDMARQHGVPAFLVKFRGQPRAALGYSLMPLLALASKVGMIAHIHEQVEEAISLMEEEAKALGPEVAESPAKALARRLKGRLVVVYGAQHLAPVARRFKTQVNENAKAWAFWEELPEADHNAVLGYGLPTQVAGLTTVVMLRGQGMHPRILLRYHFTRRLLEEAGVDVQEIEAKGQSPLAQMLSSTLLLDYASCYLAFLNQVDPTSTYAIDRLKRWMSQV